MAMKVNCLKGARLVGRLADMTPFFPAHDLAYLQHRLFVLALNYKPRDAEEISSAARSVLQSYAKNGVSSHWQAVVSASLPVCAFSSPC
jgi:hypothetical protein